jgi:hypothetical protein
MKHAIIGALALSVLSGAASAAPYVYDFKTEANASGQIGEAIFRKFNTSTNGVFSGPNLEVRATKVIDDVVSQAFVYFDNGNAGMGVCGKSMDTNARINQYNPGSGANLCDPGSDDGLTTTGETLNFKATETALTITSFFINTNHDTGDILDTVWNIGGTSYDKDDFTLASGGDVRIDVNFMLGVGETLSLFGEAGPNSYISAISATSLAPVPLPAAGMMLLAGLAGLGGLRAARGRSQA